MIKKKFTLTKFNTPGGGGANRYPVSMLLATGFVTRIDLEADPKLDPDRGGDPHYVDFDLKVCGRSLFHVMCNEKGTVTFTPPIPVHALDTFVGHIYNATTRVTVHFEAETFDPPTETWDHRRLPREYVEDNMRRLAPTWEDDE